MKKLVSLLMALSFVLALVPATAFAGDAVVYPLMAGQNLEVGTVTVSDDGTNLTVTYEITDLDWYITETHLYVDNKKAPKKGNPGQFPYEHLDLNTQTDTYTIPLSEFGVPSGDELYIAAHAVVQKQVGEDCTYDLSNSPSGTVTIQVAYPGPNSYFDTTIAGLGLEGTYAGWCVDTSRTINPGQTYEATVTSSYDPAAAALVDNPQNLDLVNYIINQGYVGQPSPSGGTYTYGDVQRAIWALVDDQNSTAGLGSWTPSHVDEIIADALANGEGFVPGEGDVVALILNPIDASANTNAQVTIAQITMTEWPLTCTPVYQSETGWGAGDLISPKGNWAMCFTYKVQ